MFNSKDFQVFLDLRARVKDLDSRSRYQAFRESHPAEAAYYVAAKWANSRNPLKRRLGGAACVRIASGASENAVLKDIGRQYVESATTDMIREKDDSLFLVQVSAPEGIRYGLKTGQEVIDLLGISSEKPDNLKIYKLDKFGSVTELLCRRGVYDDLNYHEVYEPYSWGDLARGYSSTE
jgi:hypothetical protein